MTCCCTAINKAEWEQFADSAIGNGPCEARCKPVPEPVQLLHNECCLNKVQSDYYCLSATKVEVRPVSLLSTTVVICLPSGERLTLSTSMSLPPRL